MYTIHVHDLKKVFHLYPWNIRVLETLKFPQLDKEFLAFYATKIHYLVHRSSPLVPIIPQTNAVHNVTSYSLQRQFNKILQTKWSHYFKFFPPKFSILSASLSRVSDMSCHCHPYNMFYKE